MLRDRRKAKGSLEAGEGQNTLNEDDASARTQFTYGDVLRIIGGILLLGLLTGRLITGSVTWNLWRGSISPANLTEPSVYWTGQDLPRAFSMDQLQEFNGSRADLPLLLAIQGQVFDVSRKSGMYGPRGPYNRLVGTDCSKAFSYGMWSMQGFRKPCSDDLSGLSDEALQRVFDWVKFFQDRYPHIGYVIDSRFPQSRSEA
ncbi:LAFA_0G13432g1_1 [Lachancea sp. 'fantastica']|nr:LAFA_0G13432g1_1 [Lachancea sp. 'fantastica']